MLREIIAVFGLLYQALIQNDCHLGIIASLSYECHWFLGSNQNLLVLLQTDNAFHEDAQNVQYFI